MKESHMCLDSLRRRLKTLKKVINPRLGPYDAVPGHVVPGHVVPGYAAPWQYLSEGSPRVNPAFCITDASAGQYPRNGCRLLGPQRPRVSMLVWLVGVGG